MKKLILFASFACIGMVTSCQKDDLFSDGAMSERYDNMKSVYEELRSGTNLTGTFNTYLRLVDDLGYTEVLSKTGSKTVFPANDDAFERFFQKNPYGVSSYEQLTDAMKKQILYSSMLDNAMLSGMLSNVSAGDGNNVNRGVAMKHETGIAVTDSITTILNGALMPQNNPYWDRYRIGGRGISVVYDATKPMLVHFTQEQMRSNNITFSGADCDYGILRGEQVGAAVTDTVTCIFQNKIIKSDVTCLNGYVHQVNDVIVPPGNMAQVLRTESNTKLFSRILDYHCAPYYDAQTTNDYNAWARQNGYLTIDSIFQVRYFSQRSQFNSKENNYANVLAPDGSNVPSVNVLDWDPGWNKYYPSSGDELANMGAILVPTDQAIKDYFLPGGGGAYFIDLYGSMTNTEENLPQNLDDLFNKGNGVLTAFVKNLMQNSFVGSVPSKFNTITQTSGDFMGLTKGDLQITDGKYDVVVANNGVIYKLNTMIAPDQYQSVMGPALIYPNMSIMNSFLNDKTDENNKAYFGAEMYYYLLAMKANYICFIPTNEAFAGCYIDPVSLGMPEQRALEFYTYEEAVPNSAATRTRYGVKVHSFNKDTGAIGEVRNDVKDIFTRDASNQSPYASQVKDMLNYSTVVLQDKEEIVNNYYLTMHGGAVRISNYRFDQAAGTCSGTLEGGAQIDNGLPAAHITEGWKEKNGWAFRLDNVIQPSITSVYSFLTDKSNGRFDDFVELCEFFGAESDLLSWAGISSLKENGSAVSPQDRYVVFSSKEMKALNQNVNFFNGYNYTFYAPNNDAMAKAYNMGLPRIDDLRAIYTKYAEAEDGEYSDAEIEAAKAEVLEKLIVLRSFVRYHFHSNSVFADNHVPEKKYQSLYSSELGIPVNITVRSENGMMYVTDNSGNTINIDARSTTKLVNKMARDYEYDTEVSRATSIALSSFAVIHEVDDPLCFNSERKYDSPRTVAAQALATKNYKKLLQLANNYKD